MKTSTTQTGFYRSAGEFVPVTIEIQFIRRLPRIVVVGISDRDGKDLANRVQHGIVGAGFEFPRQRVLIRICPGRDLSHKEKREIGNQLDYVIAREIIVLDGQFDEAEPGLQRLMLALRPSPLAMQPIAETQDSA